MLPLLQNLVISLCHEKDPKFVLAVSTALPILPGCPALQIYSHREAIMSVSQLPAKKQHTLGQT